MQAPAALAPLILTGGLAVLAVILFARWLEARSWARSLVAYRLRLPAGLEAGQVAAWLGAVAAGTHAPRFPLLPPPPIALEVTASSNGIEHILCIPDSMREAMLAALRAHLPGARAEERPNYLASRHRPRFAAEALLSSHRRPMAGERAASASAGLLAALQPLGQGERVTVQWILTGAGTPRPVSSVTSSQSGNRVDSEAIRAERQKIDGPLLRGSLRVGIEAAVPGRIYSLFGRVWGACRLLNAPGVQVVRRLLPSFVVTGRLERFAVPLAKWPFLLNAAEAAGLVGLPLDGVSLPGLSLGSARQLPPALSLPGTGAVIGMSNYPGLTDRRLALRPADRLRHALVLGPTGSGKSWLLARLILGDIAAGHGVFVVDMKGGLVGDVLSRINDADADRVIVLDPGRRDYPVGVNLLSGGDSEDGRERVVDNVLTVFKEIWAAYWGPRSDQVMRAALTTLAGARSPGGGRFTLVELVPLLSDPAFRRGVLTGSQLPDGLRAFWQRYEAMSDGERSQAIAPVLNKVEAFTSRSAIRLMLGQSEGIDLRDLFRKRAVVLVNLAKGNLGTETASLLGALLVTKLWQATLAQASLPADRRRTAFAYIDEAQDVVRLPVPMAEMLSQARGLGLGVTLAHQYVAQLPETVKAAVLGTVQSQIAFALNRTDAQTLAPDFAPLTADDLMGLDAHEVAIRPCVGGTTLSPVTGTTLPLGEPTRDGDELARQSRTAHGRPRADVEAAIAARLEVGKPGLQLVGRQTEEDDE
jgi:Helicase HerA, central domain